MGGESYYRMGKATEGGVTYVWMLIIILHGIKPENQIVFGTHATEAGCIRQMNELSRFGYYVQDKVFCGRVRVIK